MSPTWLGILGEVAPAVMNGTFAAWNVGPEASTESVSVYPMKTGTLSCSTNCFAVWAVTSILYWLSWMMRSICDPLTPPAALSCFAASFAPFAAGRSSADSSPVRAKPPPILIVPPPAAELPLAPDAAVVAAGDAAPEAPPPGVVVEQAATRTITLANAKTLRVMSPPPNRRTSVRHLDRVAASVGRSSRLEALAVG